MSVMKAKSFIILFLCAVIMAWADSNVLLPRKKHRVPVKDSLALNDAKDSLQSDNLKDDDAAVDTTAMDSLQLAIYHHNKAVDDSIHLDSLNRQKKTALTRPSTIPPTTHWSMMPAHAQHASMVLRKSSMRTWTSRVTRYT